jgi:hypothetical protein
MTVTSRVCSKTNFRRKSFSTKVVDYDHQKNSSESLSKKVSFKVLDSRIGWWWCLFAHEMRKESKGLWSLVEETGSLLLFRKKSKVTWTFTFFRECLLDDVADDAGFLWLRREMMVMSALKARQLNKKWERDDDDDLWWKRDECHLNPTSKKMYTMSLFRLEFLEDIKSCRSEDQFRRWSD